MRDLKYDTLVCLSTNEAGGAELSVIEWLTKNSSGRVQFVLPGNGGIEATLREFNFPYVIVNWPQEVFSMFSRSGGLSFSAFITGLWGLPGVLRNLNQVTRNCKTVISVGTRSHLLWMMLLLLRKKKVVFQIRDFYGKPFRIILNLTHYLCDSELVANSRIIASCYPSAKVHYPILPPQKINPPIKDKQMIIVTHIGHFAPYKGQLIFVELALQCLEMGKGIQFWLIGGVPYQNKIYSDYHRMVLDKICFSGKKDFFKVFGHLTPLQTRKMLQKSHVLLHCTQSPEPFGRVIVEALSEGCEVFCHKQSGACEVLNTGNQKRFYLPDNLVLPSSIIKVDLGMSGNVLNDGSGT